MPSVGTSRVSATPPKAMFMAMVIFERTSMPSMSLEGSASA